MLKNYIFYWNKPISIKIKKICKYRCNEVNYKEGNDNENIYDYLTSKFNNSFAIFLKLNGDKASQIIVYDKELNSNLSI